MAELKITKDNFEAEVLHAKHPVLLDSAVGLLRRRRLVGPEGV